jgi:hypothetical protein
MGRDMLGAMSEEHPACVAAAKLLAECDVRHERRSGPGGQHRNKVSTAVVLLHRPTGVRAEANERRSQFDNRREALRRLRVRLALDVRSTAKRDAASSLWKSRVTAERLAINPSHDDFPALLAEALDVAAAREFDVAAAAEFFGVSGSQFVRFLKHEPAAWMQVNAGRRQRGLRTLH